MSRMRWFFLFFFFSGLCSLLYEVIWLRLGMAQFGVTTALISLFLSIFLAGLGLGSWGFGKLANSAVGIHMELRFQPVCVDEHVRIDGDHDSGQRGTGG